MHTRNTIQRSLVLEAVKKLRCHATSDEVYDTLVKKYPNISRGTVYRNLNLLSAGGEIRKVEMEFIADLEKNIKDTHGFEFTGHDNIFKGTCLECKK